MTRRAVKPKQPNPGDFKTSRSWCSGIRVLPWTWYEISYLLLI